MANIFELYFKAKRKIWLANKIFWPFFLILSKNCDFFGQRAKKIGHFWMARFGQVFFLGQHSEMTTSPFQNTYNGPLPSQIPTLDYCPTKIPTLRLLFHHLRKWHECFFHSLGLLLSFFAEKCSNAPLQSQIIRMLKPQVFENLNGTYEAKVMSTFYMYSKLIKPMFGIYNHKFSKFRM